MWQQQANGSLLNPQSGKVLDAAGGSSADGTQIQIWTGDGSPQQRWIQNGPGRVTLFFDGANLGAFQNSDGSAPSWPVSAGSAEVLGGDLRTKQTYGDFKLHAEFWLPNLPADVTGQQRANSGIYLQDRYEVQVLDTYGKSSLANNDCAAIYLKRAPSANAGTAPETWQTYDITFRAARWSGNTKVENARLTLVWNGQKVHDNIEIDGPTGAAPPRVRPSCRSACRTTATPAPTSATATSGSNPPDLSSLPGSTHHDRQFRLKSVHEKRFLQAELAIVLSLGVRIPVLKTAGTVPLALVRSAERLAECAVPSW